MGGAGFLRLRDRPRGTGRWKAPRTGSLERPPYGRAPPDIGGYATCQNINVRLQVGTVSWTIVT